MDAKKLILTGLVVCCATHFALSDKVLKVDNFESKCPGKRHLPIVYREFQMMNNEDQNTLVSVVVEVKENLNGPVKNKISVERCSKRDPNRCTTFRQIEDENYCETIENHSSPLSSMYRTMKPRWRCPFRKGTYRLVNKSLDTKMMLMLMSDNYYYKIRAELFDRNSGKQLMCVSGRGYLDTVERAQF